MASGQERRSKLRSHLRRAGVDALLVTNFVNVTYLTGFTGDDSYLLLTARQAILLSDPRYTQQIGEECPGLAAEIRAPGTNLLDLAARVIRQTKARRLGVEAQSMTLGLRDQLAGRLPQLEFHPLSGLVEELREIKDAAEVATIRAAIEIAERAYGVVRAGLRAESTEREVAFELEHQIRRFGGEGCSFPAIVAAGPRAALPHARPTDAHLGEHDLLLVDWGARAGLYVSDLTRVLAMARISPKLERIYGVVFKAQAQAIAAIRPGAQLRDVDAAARQVIADAGFGKRFGHGLGHGIGLEIHEAPRLAANQDRSLKTGMVVTVEPGIYLPGWGGVRIEDDVLVTRSGYEVLTTLPRQLESWCGSVRG